MTAMDKSDSIQSELEQMFGGCYLLYDGNEIVYVGESENVGARIKTHLAESKKSFTSFRFIRCQDRKKTEAALIGILRPKYNVDMRGCWDFGSVEEGGRKNVLATALDKLIFLLNSDDKEPSVVSFDVVNALFGCWRSEQKRAARKALKKYGAILDDDQEKSFDSLHFDLNRIARYRKLIQDDFDFFLCHGDKEENRNE